ncbi:MAG TPA: NosD domain-containing protein, partial [Candidatus Thermoplasmatota archaeon]|nr:NosD domain-containing protein [Candidatus Thermoplasmatota archaeon]
REASGGVVEGGLGRVIIVGSSGIVVRDQTSSVEISHSSSITVTGSSGFVALLWSSNNLVRENAFTGSGIHLEASSSNVIERNVFSQSSLCANVYGSPSNVFQDNRFDRCARALRIENARFNLVDHNLFLDSSEIGIESFSTGLGNDGTAVRRNAFAGNALGIRVYMTPITVQQNNVAGNGIGLRMDSPAIQSAPDNWWGCPAGPGASGCDAALGPVSVAPVSAAPHATAGPR